MFSKNNDFLTVALPKGALFAEAVELLGRCGLNTDQLLGDSRKLFFTDAEQEVNYLICRPTDIPTFVEYGAADLGIVGKDTIAEQGKDVYELLDLKFGFCRFVVAAPKALTPITDWSQWAAARVATKFPRVAEQFFQSKGLQMEIIKLHGNIELAPLVGLADLIVDLVSTGRTLRENNLAEVEEIFPVTARLIANRVNLRIKDRRIGPLLEKLKFHTSQRHSDC
ncbi:ATP phosphoribosyltransferase catalytic subunit [Carboxydocella sporoproducens DSM 16521]|uniref:ATP phosphoribosyltransferase n=2 Tax=Carboxydocella TaxID=178898 RepID=A0A1T4R6Z4_9FIRM|nr:MULTISPECIES: ATP phosphoribosyltransferase [Carboxydocella]AVX19394.1 ATP phosphoribosyltransferase [Carboxydocella thermautotrophica]AVX29808.1 ATP phosphoribosyltransferase [Carboxydocella thermautotrophica]SKA11448.1 ATP phosphoribosyltransferase catalytic subunit [Carboxydocella sporoproducens DSM 16521]